MIKSLKQTTKLVLLHGAAYVRCRPVLKRGMAAVLMRFPFVRARLVRFAGEGIMQGLLVSASLRDVTTVDQLTANGRAIYSDLLEASRATKK